MTQSSRPDYVTLNRRRPAAAVTEETIRGGGVQSATPPALEYVTINRGSARRTTESPDIIYDDEPNVNFVDSSSFRQRPQRQRTTTEEPTTTTAAPTTTTTRPARIVVPDAILNPVDLKPNLNLNLDPRKRVTTTQTPLEDINYEYYYYIEDYEGLEGEGGFTDVVGETSLPEVVTEAIEPSTTPSTPTTTSTTTTTTEKPRPTINLLAEFPALSGADDSVIADDSVVDPNADDQQRYHHPVTF